MKEGVLIEHSISKVSHLPSIALTTTAASLEYRVRVPVSGTTTIKEEQIGHKDPASKLCLNDRMS
jgi:hypothetical protein